MYKIVNFLDFSRMRRYLTMKVDETIFFILPINLEAPQSTFFMQQSNIQTNSLETIRSTTVMVVQW